MDDRHRPVEVDGRVFLTADAAAAQVRVPRHVFDNWTRTGRLKAVAVVDRLPRYDAAEVARVELVTRRDRERVRRRQVMCEPAASGRGVPRVR